MRPSLVLMLALPICGCGCSKGTLENRGQPASIMGWTRWFQKEDTLVTALEKKQDANLVRLAQQRALEQAIEEQAIEEQAREEQARQERASRSRRTRVPPSMYRTTEPPLPEPDLSLPVQEVPHSAPSPKRTRSAR